MSKSPTDCPNSGTTEALAKGALSDDRKRQAQAHLEHCAGCRQRFATRSAGRYPKIAHYTILESVGRGGFGEVYKAIHHEKERTEALKLLFGKTPLLTSYFENEVHLIARLRHPNIAILYEAHLSEPPPYYTMEFVEGQRLNDYLRSCETSLADRIEIVRQVALAVGYAHQRGVVHRDLKPQNILIDAGGLPHVVDFGISKRLNPEDADGPRLAGTPEGAVGTLGYIAPEQISGGAVDARSDIYALGAVLFNAVSGEPARSVKTPERVAQVLRERRVSNPGDLAAIIARCVENEPARRFPNCEALAADLDRYIAGRPPLAAERRALGYRALRVSALVLRDYPHAVRAALLASVFGFVTLCLWGAKARALPMDTSGERSVLIEFDQETQKAIHDGTLGADIEGLSATDIKSWRLLHGRLMELLAETPPRVLVWDSHSLDCQTEFDPALIRGIQSLQAPVVFGCHLFDVNGEPNMCAELRAVSYGCGAIQTVAANFYSGEFELPLCTVRGLNPPIPSLALMAYCASRHADCLAEYFVHSESVEVRYRRRAEERGRPRYINEIDEIPTLRVYKVTSPQRNVDVGDQVVHARVRALSDADLVGRVVPYRAIFSADIGERRAWFEGRVVLVGFSIPGVDQQPLRDGHMIFGHRLQMSAIDSLLSGQMLRYSRRDLATRVGLWCALTWLLVTVTPAIRRRAFWPFSAACVSLALVGILLALFGAAHVATLPTIEVIIGLSTIVVAFAAAYWAKTVREQQLDLAPAAITLAPADSDAPSTVLAQPHTPR
ncbi:MAG: protein kinase [Phycisphaerae bacterium]